MRITWLADVLRDAGLTVVEHSGWKTHERPGSWEPRYGVVHATAAPRSQDDDVQVRVVRDGRPDLRGPIANACVDRRGRWHVLSAGRCNTTVAGTAGPFDGLGNTHALGVEACNDNRAEPWPAVQYDAYVRGWAAICRRLGWPASKLVGHKEHTPGRKTDPTFSMSTFRSRVAAAIEGDDMPTEDQIADRVIEKQVAALQDKDSAFHQHMRAIAWKYPVTATRSALATLSGMYDAIAANAAAEAQRDAAHTAALAGMTTLLQTISSANGALTEQQVAALTDQVGQAAAAAGAQATAVVVAKLDSLREHLGDDD